MRCARCGFENAANTKFCGECASPLPRPCPACGFENPSQYKFCGQCAAPLTLHAVSPASKPATAPTSEAQQSEAIHIARQSEAPSADAPPDGERKTVTALFADIKG